MSQPVKLSDELVIDARVTSQAAQRSIAGQIEYWAQLGRAVEPMLTGEKALALLQNQEAKPLSELLSTVDTPAGHQRLKTYLENQPYPHYEAAKNHPGMLLRTTKNGERTVGRFVRGKFVPHSEANKEDDSGGDRHASRQQGHA